ncbi:hypothetical protein R52603_05586 [Paraburkholderia saeva]|nr:hypothetical protein R52603_05586 [Paraburkholderia saeva]
MDQIQVQDIESQPQKTSVKSPKGPIVAIVGDPHLGRHEDVLPRDARQADTFPNLLLVHIGRSGVDQPVSICDCRSDRSYGFLRLATKHPKSECGHLNSIVQPVHGTFACHHR